MVSDEMGNLQIQALLVDDQILCFGEPFGLVLVLVGAVAVERKSIKNSS